MSVLHPIVSLPPAGGVIEEQQVPQAVAKMARRGNPVIPSAAEGSLLPPDAMSRQSKDPSTRAPLRGPLGRDDEWLWGAKVVQAMLTRLPEPARATLPGIEETVADLEAQR